MPSGIGGHIRIPGTPNVDVRVEEWTLDKSIETPDTTDSGSGGFREREATLKDGTGTATIIWRLTASAEDQSLDVGDEALVNLLLGSTGQAYALQILVNSVSTTNTAKGDVIRQRLGFQHKAGGITGPVAAAAAVQWVEEQYQRLMGLGTPVQAPENQRHYLQQGEAVRGEGAGERTGGGSTRSNQPERRDVARQPA